MNYQNRGNKYVSRSLEDFNNRFEPNLVENIINDKIRKSRKNQKIRILEIGCGEGRILMELRKLFPSKNIELHGINKSPWHAMNGQKSLERTGTYHNIFSKKEIENISLPKIYFYDAKELRFNDNYFDLVISQTAMQYIERKDLVIEEIWRILKEDGEAYLAMDSRRNPCPDFLNNDSPRFVIHEYNRILDKDKIIPLKDFINRLRWKGYDISYSSTKGISLIMHKNTSKQLNLDLDFDELSSIDLNLLNPKREEDTQFWGYRSVYKIRSR